MVLPVLNGLMALVFLASAALQYNDPDPLRWMAVYGAAAVAAVLWQLRPQHAALVCALAASVAIGWILSLLPEILGVVGIGDVFRSMDEKGGKVEVGREVGGLAIIAGWMAVLWWTARSRAARKRAERALTL